MTGVRFLLSDDEYHRYLVERILEQRENREYADRPWFQSAAAKLRNEMEMLPLDALSDVLGACGADGVWIYEQVCAIRGDLRYRRVADEGYTYLVDDIYTCSLSEADAAIRRAFGRDTLGSSAVDVLRQVCYNLSVGLDWDDGMVSLPMPYEELVGEPEYVILDVHGDERVYLPDSMSVVVDGEEFDDVVEDGHLFE